MGNYDQRQKILEDVKSNLRELLEIDPKSLARTDELSRDINFKNAVPHLELMFDVVRQIADRELGRLTTQQLQKIDSACKHLKAQVVKIQGFDLNQNQPRDVCESIVRNIRDSYDDCVEPLLIPLAFTATQATDYAQVEREAKGALAEVREQASDFEKFVDKTTVKVNDSLATIQQQAAEAGVSRNAQFFSEDSIAHGKSAKEWMKATIVLSGVTMLFGLLSLISAYIYTPSSSIELAQLAFSKIVILSVLSFATFWSARNYRSLRHNETLNRHRSNSLKTFKTFVEGTDDVRVKDAILLQTSNAAFSSRPTGYESNESEVNQVNPVIDVIGRTLPSPPE